jgi:hypothetical protein
VRCVVDDLTVLVPSRGRPAAAVALARAFNDTITIDTRLVFSIDADEQNLNDYSVLIRNGFVDVDVNANRSMVQALNATAAKEAASWPFAIGFMGDDHCPRTVGWDAAYLEALREMRTGIVYGNDLLQGPNLPTQVAMTTDIVRALGYMAPPDLTHLYVDNFWRDLGTAAGCLRYLPDVIVEHRHPHAGKAQWDDNYNRVNSGEMYRRDATAYDQYMRAGELHAAVEAVKTLRAAHG